MKEETKPWYTLPCYSLEQVLLLAQATNNIEALRYYDEQTKKIKEKENWDRLKEISYYNHLDQIVGKAQ